MDQKKSIFTREELYKMIWEKPIQQLAKEFGLSDVGLAKICRKHNIPRPDRGYWRKIETRKRTHQKPLPKSKNDGEVQIEIYYREKQDIQIVYSDTIQKIIEREKDPANKIIVKPTSPITHKYALRTHNYLVNAKPDMNGLLAPSPSRRSSLSVSKEALPRAVSILDTLLTALEARQLRVKWPEKNKSQLRIILSDLEITLFISEKLDRGDHIPTKEEIAEQERFSYWTPPKWEYYPSGKLSLNIHTPSYIPGIQCNWKDGKVRRLENFLNDLIIELYKIPEEHIKEQARLKQQEIERVEQQKRAMEREKQLAEERRKIELLLSAAEHWKEAMHLQAFCKSLESACLTETLTIEQKASVEEIVALLNGYSQLINPLSSIEKLLEKFKSGYKWMYQRYW